MVFDEPTVTHDYVTSANMLFQQRTVQYGKTRLRVCQLHWLSTLCYSCLLLSAGACSAPADINRHLLQTTELRSKPAGRRCCWSTGQRDGQMPDHYIDPALHTMPTESITGHM